MLGLSVSSVSDRLRELEERIGARLFHRSTRSLALTAAGSELLKNLAPAMQAVDAALDSVGRTPNAPAGKLRINAAPPAADLVLGPMLGGFLQRHPFISVDLVVDDGLLDIVEAGFDAGIRYEENLAADMIAVQLGRPQRYALVAAPALLARCGRPVSRLARQSMRIPLPTLPLAVPVRKARPTFGSWQGADQPKARQRLD